MAQEDFEKNKYVLVENAISKEMADLLCNYTLFKKKFAFHAEGMIEGTHAQYGDHLMESLLLVLLPKIQEHTGLELYPTYSFYRVYKPGDQLPKHRDRPSCEISVSINFGYEYETDKEDYSWNLWADGKEFVTNPGDMLIYRGTELEHWREPFDVDRGWQSQAFLHYVDANGPYQYLMNDARPDLGYEQWIQDGRKLDMALKTLQMIRSTK